MVDQELPLHKIVMVGLGGTGKTALTMKFIFDFFIENYEPTITDSYGKKMVLDGKNVEVDILDTAGQEEYVSITDTNVRNGDGFLCVFSLTDIDSFHNTGKFRDQIIRVKNDTNVPMYLIGNKCDLNDERKVDRIVCENLAEEWNVPYVEASAKTGENVDSAFCNLLREIIGKKFEFETKKKSSSKCCCCCAVL